MDEPVQAFSQPDPVNTADIAKVRGYFDASTNEQVADKFIVAQLHWFKGDSHRHMLAARSIVRAREAER